MYLRAALRYTYSKVAAPYVVHELKDVPHLHGDVIKRPEDFHLDIEQDFRCALGDGKLGNFLKPSHPVGCYMVWNDILWELSRVLLDSRLESHLIHSIGE